MKNTVVLVLALVAGLLSACDSDNVSWAARTHFFDEDDDPNVIIVVEDAPSDELLAFSAVVRDVRLVRADGSTSAALLAGELAVELLALRERPRWIAHARVPAGEYVAARVSFRPLSYLATTPAGERVDVDARSDVLVAQLDAPLRLVVGARARVTIDVDVGASLAGSIEAPPLAFEPVGSARAGDGAEPLAIEPVRGVVVAADADALELDAFADGDGAVALGRALVRVTADGSRPRPGERVVVHGVLGADGSIDAARVEVESAGAVVVRGRVVSRAADGLVRLALSDVERGGDVVGSPGAIDVVVDEPALEPGARVRAWLAGGAPPLRAERVEVEDERRSGVVARVDGLTGSVEVRLDGSLSSTVFQSGDVDVALVRGGQRVDVAGAELARVHPGRLAGALVASVARAGDAFATVGGALEAPFGEGVSPGPFTVEIGSTTRFEGDARSVEAFVALVRSAAAGTCVEVDVEGLADADPGRLRAAVVRARRAEL